MARIKLRDFLDRINEAGPELLPLVHTTQGFHLDEILSACALKPTGCNVFRGEDLCYAFVGRPSYKVKNNPHPEYWELPIAFVIRFDPTLSFKRAFPFDSGAFKKTLLPSAITCFDLERFNIAGDHEFIRKLVGVFFRNNESYMRARARTRDSITEQHEIGPREMEIDALISLYNLPRTDSRDDRGAAIEVQSEIELPITPETLLGVILPEPFQADPEIKTILA